ncbi:hypothetical protein SAY86_006148 [Trapa natans]|uniref:Uncharacterized protein n=1 Tax=Trapa natans TaxID=22666 RepID=A0AAN7L4Q5_TRANT|nr:hypothetical protein SAY86_006148 [Trapa natans]
MPTNCLDEFLSVSSDDLSHTPTIPPFHYSLTVSLSVCLLNFRKRHRPSTGIGIRLLWIKETSNRAGCTCIGKPPKCLLALLILLLLSECIVSFVSLAPDLLLAETLLFSPVLSDLVLSKVNRRVDLSSQIACLFCG